MAREREREEKERKKESDWIQEWFLLASNENIIYLLQFHCSIVQREINFEIIFVVILCWNFKKYVFTPFREAEIAQLQQVDGVNDIKEFTTLR